MPRLRLLILSFLCLLALATQAHANYAFTHSDHLGSASWITDDAAHPVQYIHYAPYGELVANQQATGSTYDERYKFIGKERDAESGYDYFGARFLAHQLGIWLSVDPLVDKYLYVTPYMYCNGNPIVFMDPDGRKIVVGTWYGRLFARLGVNNFEAKVLSQLNALKEMDSKLDALITNLEDTPTKFYIEKKSENNYNPQTKTIEYDPDNDTRKNGEKRPPKAALAHELGHAENDKNGTTVYYNSNMANGKTGTRQEQAKEQEKRDRNEINSIEYENIVREKEGYPQRGYNYSAGD